MENSSFSESLNQVERKRIIFLFPALCFDYDTASIAKKKEKEA